MLAAPVNNAPKEYDQGEESRFRRQVELYLESLSADISRASSLSGTVSSLASRRVAMTGAPVGVGAIGTDAGSTIVTPAGGTTRTLVERFNEVINVRDYGATGDGTTDDAPAFNAAFAALRATLEVVNGAGAYPQVVYIPPGVYRINSTIDATDIYGGAWAVEGSGSIINARCTGKPAFDMMGTRFGRINQLRIEGHVTDTPSWGIQHGVSTSHGVASSMSFTRCQYDGYFSKGCHYDYASEIGFFDFCTFWNRYNSSDSYTMVTDGGLQEQFDVTSEFTTLPNHDTVKTFNSVVFNNCDFRKMAQPASGPSLYMAATSSHHYRNCYAVSYGDACVTLEFQKAGTGGGTQKQMAFVDLILEMHCETDKMDSAYLFKGTTASTTGAAIRGCSFVDHAPQASDSVVTGAAIFKCDAGLTNGIELRDYDLRFHFFSKNGPLFDPPGSFSLDSGEMHFGESSSGVVFDEAVNRESGIRDVLNRDTQGSPAGSQMSFSKTQDDIGVKGAVRVFDAPADRVAPGELGENGEVVVGDGGLQIKFDGTGQLYDPLNGSPVIPSGASGYATIYIDSVGSGAGTAGDLYLKIGAVVGDIGTKLN